MSRRRTISNTFSVSTLQDGENAILADLDNEMDSITCSNEGKVTTGQSVQTNVAMYYGTTRLQSTIAVYNGSYQYTSGTAHDGITVTINNTTGNVLVYFGVSSSYVRNEKETFKIRLTAVIDGVNVARDLYFVVNCIRGTAVYRLVPSVSQVVLKKDGSYEPTGTGYITCAVVKTMNGVESTPAASEYVLTYILNGGDETPYSATAVQVEDITSTLVFKLRKTSGGSVLDQETIPLVVDGEDGDDAHEVNPNILVDTLEFKDSSKWFNLRGTKDGMYEGHACWYSVPSDAVSGSNYVRAAEQLVYDPNASDASKKRLEPSTWYTISVYTKHVGSILISLLQAGGSIENTVYKDGVESSVSLSGGQDLAFSITQTETTWVRHSLTFKTKSSFASYAQYVSFRLNNMDSGSYIRISMPKLETGKYATAYLPNDEDLVGADGAAAHEINPNILLRTVFDSGIDRVKEKWRVYPTAANVFVDTSADTVIQGRKSIRIKSTYSQYEDFQQDVIGNVKPSTWYTLSFYYLATHAFSTFVYSGTQGHPAIDQSVGVYVNGQHVSTVSSDGSHSWDASWIQYAGQYCTFTFKTAADLTSAQHVYILFRANAGQQAGASQDNGTDVAVCMPKLEVGMYATAYMANEDDLFGTDGQRGKIGRFFYYAGVFDQNSTSPSFPINDAQAPYFMTGNNFHVFNPEENPSGGSMTMAEMWAATETSGTPPTKSFDNKPWEVMYDDFKYLITEAIFGKYAQFGSAIINGDWMLSTNGKIGNTAYDDGALWNGIPAYMLFNPLFPKGVGSASIALLKTSTTQRWSSGWDTMTETFMLNQYNTYIVEVTGHTTSSSVSAGIRLKFGDGNTDGTNNLNLGTFSGTSSQTLWSVVTVPSVCTDCRLTCGLSASGTAYIERITIRSTNIVPVTRASSLTSSYNDITNLMTLAKGVLYAITVNLSSSGSTSHLQLYYPDSSTSVAETSGTGSQLTVRFSRTDAQTYARFRLQAKSTGSVTVTSITITADSRVSPIAFAPNYCVDLRRGDGFFKGVVTANLMYSSTKQMTGDDSVTLNPFLDMCDTFLIKDISNTKNIYLPFASDYDGLEYSFIYGIINGSSYTYKYCYINRSGNDTIYVPQTSSQTLVGTQYFTMPPNTIVKLKAIAGAWYVLQGLES